MPVIPAGCLCVLQGGSVTPEAAAVLSELRGRGVLEVQEHREVLDVAWDWEQQQWDVMLEVSCDV